MCNIKIVFYQINVMMMIIHYIKRFFVRGGGAEMLGIPVILMLEISYQRRRVLIDFVYDTNHWLAVINQPKSICNIVFYHINVMVMNVFVRIFHLGGGG